MQRPRCAVLGANLSSSVGPGLSGLAGSSAGSGRSSADVASRAGRKMACSAWDDCWMDLPLLEGDFESQGVIEPALTAAKNVDMPERAVLCFFGEVVAGDRGIAIGRPSGHGAVKRGRPASRVGD